MKITRVETHVCHARMRNWVFVKVLTDQDGLFGWGEATLEWHTRAVVGAVEDLAQLVVGEDPTRVEYLWQMMYRQHFWHGHGIVRATAIAGIDLALWDILGKVCGVPWRLGLRLHCFRCGTRNRPSAADTARTSAPPPSTGCERRTTRARRPRRSPPTDASRGRTPQSRSENPPSAITSRTRGSRCRAAPGSPHPPSRSRTSAVATDRARIDPSASTPMGRLRPSTFLAPVPVVPVRAAAVGRPGGLAIDPQCSRGRRGTGRDPDLLAECGANLPQVRSDRRWRDGPQTVCRAGESWGRIRHAPPARGW